MNQWILTNHSTIIMTMMSVLPIWLSFLLQHVRRIQTLDIVHYFCHWVYETILLLFLVKLYNGHINLWSDYRISIYIGSPVQEVQFPFILFLLCLFLFYTPNTHLQNYWGWAYRGNRGEERYFYKCANKDPFITYALNETRVCSHVCKWVGGRVRGCVRILLLPLQLTGKIAFSHFSPPVIGEIMGDRLATCMGAAPPPPLHLQSSDARPCINLKLGDLMPSINERVGEHKLNSVIWWCFFYSQFLKNGITNHFVNCFY